MKTPDAPRSGGTSGPASEKSDKLDSLQVLRALAATLVVWTHADMLFVRLARLARPAFESGAFGVDIFFVISGCVITIACRRDFGNSDARSSFLRRRLARIYPPYWFYATLTCAIAFAAGARPAFSYLAQSYLLLPVLNEAGKLRPILGVGWTLSYELYFYAAFALVLGGSRGRSLMVLGALLGGMAFLASAFELQGAWGIFLRDRVVLEFFVGTLIGASVDRLARWPRWLGPCLAAAGTAAWLLSTVPAANDRWLHWGLPAALIVLGALVSEKTLLWPSSPRWLVGLGDASYSLYLLHPVYFTVLSAIATRVAWVARIPVPLAVSLAVLTSVAVSWPAYRHAELPLIRKARRWLTPQGTAQRAVTIAATPPS